MPLTKINNRSLSGQVTNAQVPALEISKLPSGSVIQTDTNTLWGGRDFTSDALTTSTSYINLTGALSPNRVMQVSLNNVQSTSVLKFHYQVGLTYNSNGSTNSWVNYNIWETNAQKYVANTTDYSGSSDPYIVGVWTTTRHSGLFGFVHTTIAGQFSGNCTFQLRMKTNGNNWNYHWHSSRIPHTFSVMEIKA